MYPIQEPPILISTFTSSDCFETISSKTISQHFNKDTLLSDLYADNKKTESYRGCIKRWAAMPFQIIWYGVRRILCILTLGHFFKGQVAEIKDIIEILKEVIDIWNTYEATKEKMQNIWETCKKAFPKIEGQMIQTYIKIVRDAQLGPEQGDAKKIQAWNDKFKAKYQKEVEDKLKAFDADFIQSFSDKLSSS